MHLQCAECQYRMLPDQQRCPECGREGAPLRVIGAGTSAELKWHRGWPALGGLTVLSIAGIVLAVIVLLGGPGLGLLLASSCWGLFAFAIGAAVVAAVRRRAGGQADAHAIGFDNRALYLAEEQWTTPLESIEELILTPTARDDRWKLDLLARPVAAAVSLETLEAIFAENDLDEEASAVSPGGSFPLVLAGDESDARSFVDELTTAIETARSGRPRADVAEIFEHDGAALVIRDESGHEVVRADAGGVAIGATPRRLAWPAITRIDLAVERVRDGAWLWTLTLERAPAVVLGLEVARRPRRATFHHDHPAIGPVLWEQLEEWRALPG